MINKKFKNTNAYHNNNGFTLVELIVVLVLMTIVTAVSVFGIIAWQDYSRFNKQNDYAETLFSAAQNQFTEYENNGNLKEFVAKCDKLPELDVTSLKDENGTPYELDKIWGESAGESIDNAYKYMGKIYSAKCEKGDYAAYLSGQKVSLEAEIVFTLLSSFVYDGDVLNESVCVEFAPEQAQVFAVLYSDYAEGFTYGEENGKIKNIRDRQRDSRKEKMIGYYGVDSLYIKTSGSLMEPSLSDVRLNNEETLNLSFSLNKEKNAIGRMAYDIKVYDKNTKNLVLSFTLDGTEVKGKDSAQSVPCDVTRYTYDAFGNMSQENLGSYMIPAWGEVNDRTGNKMIRVVFDAADLSADVDKSFSSDEYKDTFSFLRFGIDSENIYCSIQGSGNDYKTTAIKKTNSSAVLFAAADFESGIGTNADSHNYSIKNARHLYNIRYIEDKAPLNSGDRKGYIVKAGEQVHFTVIADIDWKKFTDENWLFESDVRNAEKLFTEETYFPSVRMLRPDDCFSGNGSIISGLSISYDENIKYNVLLKNNQKDTATGFFIVNLGTVENLSFDGIQVEGTDKTGAFCGKNAGNLTNLSILNSNDSSFIKGNNYVGGITGYLAGTGNIYLNELNNEAEVTGNCYIGGIVGMVYADDEDDSADAIVINECQNSGKISGITENTYFIGGITGCCINKTSAGDNIVIKDCKGMAFYNELPNEQISDLTKGCYVGGIVGYNYYGKIENCNTITKNGENGFIFGNTYVGGIIGFNQGPENGENIIGGNDNHTTNYINVIGNRYAGGIVGCNAGTENNMMADVNVIVEPDKTGYTGMVIKNWINKGIIIATDSYAGGITGYNTGSILNCNSEITVKSYSELTEKAGDYAGGITGYNNGKIGDGETKISTIVNVSGRNYVGGIAGFNDEGAVIQGYELTGGYINATGDYVGGFVGLNAAKSLFDKNVSGQNDYITAKPNLVQGRYFVGGTVGANIIERNDSINAYFATDNFLGEIKGKCFVGGFIGYNAFTNGENAREYADKLLSEADRGNNLNEILDNVEELASTGQSVGSIIITGLNNDITQSNVGKIEAELYVGGVIGYNSENTLLTIRNVVNKAPVTATSAVIRNEHNVDGLKKYDGDDFTYSYCGGITGYVQKNMTLINCENISAQYLESEGSYKAGLCEVNAGKIINCRVSNAGGNSNDYEAGICGINKGYIAGCYFNETIMMGGNYVAGMVIHNYGIITDTYSNDNDSTPQTGRILSFANRAITRKITGVHINADSNGAVIAAYNMSSGEIFLNNDISDCFCTVKNENCGIITAYNEGTIRSNKSSGHVEISGGLTGGSRVGSIAGNNSSAKAITGFANSAVIVSDDGFAGGIIGRNSGKGEISDCINLGTVTARKSGNAGGITSENYGKIVKCANKAEISSPNGMCGGIAAINHKNSEINNCEVSANEGERLSVSSYICVGGISGVNYGLITDSIVAAVDFTDYTNSVKSSIGAICGKNLGTISFKNINDYAVNDCTVMTYTNQSNVGGITGINGISGIVSGMDWSNTSVPKTQVNCELGFAKGYGTIASFGGVSGINNGIIENIGVQADIASQMGSDSTGTGGIAGISEGSKAAKAIIRNCTYDGSAYGIGSYSGIMRIGGITGQNKTYSEISYCSLGKIKKTSIMTGENEKDTNSKNASFSYLGGISGSNYGTIKSCDNSNGYNVTLVAYAGMLGGIVGYNYQNAVVTGESEDKVLSTGDNWTVTSKYHCNDAGTGGILGYNASKIDMKYVINRADVTNNINSTNVSIGGFIGRNENTEYALACIEHSYNYGNVNGKVRAGGFIGILKFCPIYFKDCYNYGNIDGQKASGFVSTIYFSNSYRYQFVDCENHGIIGSSLSQYSGGFVAFYESGTIKSIDYVNCVNTGIIYAKTYAGELSGQCVNENVYRCRFYGKAYNLNQMNTYGISMSKKTSVFDSLVLNKLDDPFGEIGYSVDNYYLGSPIEDTGAYTFSYSVSAPSGDMKYSLLDTMGTDVTKRANFQQSMSINNPIVIQIKTYGQSKAMEALSIVWCNGGGTASTNRQYTYNAEFTDINGKKKTFTNRVAIGFYDPEQSIDSILLDDLNAVTEDGFVNQIKSIKIFITGVKQSTNANTTIFSSASDYVNLRAITWNPENGTRQACNSSSQNIVADLYGNNIYSVSDGSGYKLVSLEKDVVTGIKYDANDNYCSDADKYESSAYRIPLYEDVDPKYFEYVKEKYTNNIKPSIPLNLLRSASNGGYIYTWENNQDAYKYEMRYRITNEDGSPITDYTYDEQQCISYYEINNPEKYIGKYMEFSVRAVDGNDEFVSDWATTRDLILFTLPIPQYHVEMVDENGCVAILDNPEDYKIGDTYIDCEIQITGNVKCTIKPSKGYSNTINSMDYVNSGKVDAVAVVKGTEDKKKYMNSSTASKQIMWVGNKDGNASRYGNYYSVNFEGLYGDTPDALYYRSSISNISSDFTLYQAADLVCENDGMQISYSHDISYITNLSKAYIDISNIPESVIGKDFTIRTYMWQAQGYFMHYGHVVAENVTLDELKDVTDTERFIKNGNSYEKSDALSIWNEDGLLPGYAILAKDDDTYDVIYAVTLAENNTPYCKATKSIKYTFDETLGQYTNNVNGEIIKINSTPENVLMTNEGNKYTFTWDNTDRTGTYNVELRGVTIDDSEVIIDIANGLNECKYEILDANSNWNYKALKIKITSIGSVNSSNKTISLFALTEKEFSIKLRLDQMPVPYVMLSKNPDGSVNKDELKYQVMFDTVRNPDELNDLGGYLLKLVASKEENSEEKYYAIKYNNNDISDNIPDGTIYLDDVNYIGGRCSTCFDLSEFSGGTQISFSVTAIAKNQAMIFRNGPEGINYEMILPNRLGTPDNSNVVLSVPYQIDDFVTSTDFKNNLQIYLKDANATDKQASYQIAYAIFNDYDSTNSIYLQYGPFWKSESEVIPIDKTDNIVMNGNITDAKITLSDLSADYAGRFIKFTARSISASNISSWWTDEDPEDSVTDFAWLRLPRVQIDAPSVTMNQTEMYYNVSDSGWYIDKTGLEDSGIFTMKCTSISMDVSKYADIYKIKFTDKDGNDKYLICTKNDNGFTVSMDGNTKQLNKDDYVSFSSETEFVYGSMTFTPYIHVEYSSEKLNIILPDIEEINNSKVSASQYTIIYNMYIQAQTNSRQYYENSDIIRWFRDEQLDMAPRTEQIDYDETVMD